MPLLASLAVTAAACGAGPSGENAPAPGVESRPAPLPEPRTEVAGTAWDGRIVVLGGLTGSGAAATRVDAWDPGANAWSALPDYPIPIHHTAVVAFGGRLWVVGGYTQGGDGNIWVAVDRVMSLGDGEADWREEVPLPAARGALAAAVGEHGGIESLIVAGGVGEAGGVLASTLSLGADVEGESGRWLEVTQGMTTEREHFAMTAVGYDFYAVAGRAGGMETNRDSAEVLHLADPGAWEPSGTLVRSRGGFGAANVEGTPCVAGGETPEGTVAEVECLVDGEWRVVASLRTPRHGNAVVALDGNLHVIGGGPEPGLTVSGDHEVIPIPS